MSDTDDIQQSVCLDNKVSPEIKSSLGRSTTIRVLKLEAQPTEPVSLI
jgi:hypothetical protein